jgi:hypothetical protein
MMARLNGLELRNQSIHPPKNPSEHITSKICLDLYNPLMQIRFPMNSRKACQQTIFHRFFLLFSARSVVFAFRIGPNQFTHNNDMMHSKSSAAAKKKTAKVEPAPAAGGIDTPVERSKPDTSTQQATASVLDAKPSTENLPETPYKEEAAVSRKLFPESATDAKPDDEGPINHAGDKENEETEFTTVRKSELLRVVQIVESMSYSSLQFHKRGHSRCLACLNGTDTNIS